MPLWIWIESKAKSIGATLLARRDVAALTIALLAPLSVVLLVSQGGTVYPKTLTRFATGFCGLTLLIAIWVHGIRPIIKHISGIVSGNPITWNDIVLAGTTSLQTIYFVYAGFYVHFVDALVPYFFDITTSSDPDTVSQLRIVVLSQFVFLTGFTCYWAAMDRMVHVIKSLEESYRDAKQGTIGGLIATLPWRDRLFDSVLRLLTVISLLFIQSRLNLSLFTSIDPSKSSTDEIVRQLDAPVTAIAEAGGYFIILSMSLLAWDLFVRWHAKKRDLVVPTPLRLHSVTLAVSAFHFVFWFFGECWIPSVPLCGHLAITFAVLFLSWKQVIFIILAPHLSTFEVAKRRAVT